MRDLIAGTPAGRNVVGREVRAHKITQHTHTQGRAHNTHTIKTSNASLAPNRAHEQDKQRKPSTKQSE